MRRNSLEETMAKKLYVGNLSYSTTEANLAELFGKIGTVAAVTLITDRMTGRSKGFAFVEMADEAAAQEAIKQLDGKELDERTIKVAEARPPRQSDRGGAGFNRRGGGGRRSRY
jgi:RNA recognition motif-containing protein